MLLLVFSARAIFRLSESCRHVTVHWSTYSLCFALFSLQAFFCRFYGFRLHILIPAKTHLYCWKCYSSKLSLNWNVLSKGKSEWRCVKRTAWLRGSRDRWSQPINVAPSLFALPRSTPARPSSGRVQLTPEWLHILRCLQKPFANLTKMSSWWRIELENEKAFSQHPKTNYVFGNAIFLCTDLNI